MGCGGNILASAIWVGDPVNVITGARVEINRDFCIAWRLPLEWLRYWDSTRRDRMGEFGPGHFHEFERFLDFTVDGVRYSPPFGDAVQFPPLTHDDQAASLSGFRLRRVSLLRYVLIEPGKPVMVFEFPGVGGRGRLVEIRRKDRTIRITHDPSGRVLSARPGDASQEARFLRGASGKLERLELHSPGQPVRTVATFEFDAAGRLTAQIGPYGSTFRFQYDARGLCTRRTGPGGHTFLFEYDRQGRCIRARGEDGIHDVTLRYSPAQGMTEVTRGDGGVWKYFHTHDGLLTHVVDPYGGVQQYEAGAGYLNRAVDPTGAATGFLYDGSGTLIGTSDANGQVMMAGAPANEEEHPVAACASEFEWGLLAKGISTEPEHLAARAGSQYGPDMAPRPWALRPDEVIEPFGLLVRQQIRPGAARRWVYSPAGWVERYTDADGSQFTYAYESWSLLKSETSATGAVTAYGYTMEREIASIADPGGTRTEYEYDLKDRITSIRRCGVLKERYAYDAGRNMIEKTDAQGNWILRRAFGPGGVLLKRMLASGETQVFEHDKRGRMVSAAGAAGVCEFAYDAMGETSSDLRDGLGVTHEFGSDGSLLRTEVLGKFVVRYVRAGGGLVRIKDPTGDTHELITGPGRVSREHPSGATELTEYDSAGRVTHRSGNSGGSRPVVWSKRYSYSAEGDLLRVEDARHGDQTYLYDADHRLVGSLGQGQPQTFVHDAAGNLLEQPGLIGVRLAPGNRLVGANDETFEYNHREHVRARHSPDGTTTYLYDSRARLVGASVRGRPWAALYDPIGRRVRKTWNGGTTTYYWDGDRLAAELRPDGRVRVYVYADVLAMTPLMFVEYASTDAEPDTGEVFLVFGDQIGTPVRVVDRAGEVVWSAHIEPFGRARIHPASRIEFHLRFPGHLWDPELGLHYNRFRYYDPMLGRYLQCDPQGLAGGMNVYAYPASPLAHVDVRGLCPKKKAAAKRKNREDDDDDESPPAKKSKPTPVEEGEVGSYRDLRNRATVGDGMDHDHIPAYASVRDRVNAQRDADGLPPLTREQERTLRDNLTAVEVTHDVHADGRTYAGRGGEARQAQDAADPRAAAQADMDTHRPNLENRGWSSDEVDTMENQIHERNQSIGLYDDPMPDSLWGGD